MSKTIVNGHTFEKLVENFNFGDGLFINMPPCYVLDNETVPEEYFYRELKEQVLIALKRADKKLDGVDAAADWRDAKSSVAGGGVKDSPTRQ